MTAYAVLTVFSSKPKAFASPCVAGLSPALTTEKPRFYLGFFVDGSNIIRKHLFVSSSPVPIILSNLSRPLPVLHSAVLLKGKNN